MGLNCGTAIYAQYLAKEGNEVMIITSHEEDVILHDLDLPASLGIIENEARVLFRRKYLEDILGIEVIRVSKLEDVIVNNKEVRIGDLTIKCDRIVIGGEAWQDIRIGEEGQVVVRGNDVGLKAQLALLLGEEDKEVAIEGECALDEDVLRQFIRLTNEGRGEAIVARHYTRPRIVSAERYRIVGPGLHTRDPWSGAEYLIERDYQSLIMGKLLALRDLGVIDRMPYVPRLEIGIMRDMAYVSIGLSRAELSNYFQDLASSRICYRGRNARIVGKVVKRGSRAMSVQIVTKGFKPLNWLLQIYSLASIAGFEYLITDGGYEFEFGVIRGLLENLVLNVVMS